MYAKLLASLNQGLQKQIICLDHQGRGSIVVNYVKCQRLTIYKTSPGWARKKCHQKCRGKNMQLWAQKVRAKCCSELMYSVIFDYRQFWTILWTKVRYSKSVCNMLVTQHCNIPTYYSSLQLCKLYGNIPKEPWSPATSIHKQYGLYFESKRFCIISIPMNFLLYHGLIWGPLDSEAGDIPKCYRSSPITLKWGLALSSVLFNNNFQMHLP